MGGQIFSRSFSMKKKMFLSGVLIALMTVGAFAQTYTAESNFQVTKTATAVTITRYVGTATVVNIPPRIQNTAVTTIGRGAFQNNENITSMTLPEGVTTIENIAFAACANLTSLIIPSTVTSIGNQAFFNCRKLTSVTFQGAIPSGGFNSSAFDGVGNLRARFYEANSANGTPGTYTKSGNVWTLTQAANSAPASTQNSGMLDNFWEWERVGNGIKIVKYHGVAATVSIPDRINNLPVTVIGENAFSSHRYMETLTIPEGVTTIERAAFGACANLTSLILPSTVTSIGNQAFVSCRKLTSVTFQGAIPSGGFNSSAFDGVGNLRVKFYEANSTNGTPGTYTRASSTATWTRQ